MYLLKLRNNIMSSSNQTFDTNKIKICYQILELEVNASWEEVKQAYKELAFVWHPDRFAHNPKLQVKAQERLKIINQAYEMLKAYYRQKAASASKTVFETPPPPPPPPPSSSHKKQSTNQKTYQTNPSNYASASKKTAKLELSLNPIHIIREATGMLIMPTYLASVSILLPQFILIIILTFISNSTKNSELQNASDTLTSLFLLISYSFTWISGQGAVTFYVWKKLDNKNITVVESVGESINKFFTLLGATILYWIIVITGLILFIIPGFFFATSLIFYLQIIVIEKSSVIQSIKRSWQIVKGHRGMVFLNILILNSSASQFNRLTWSDDISASLFGQLMYLLVLPYTITYTTLLYKKIVEFKVSGGRS
ncbi:hypothetical protein CAL7716_051170 [Calothrix sp. PCC 7716]|nr:hypothetical protein CAL7716_051170 [Calothrix sp. PCC 7716]